MPYYSLATRALAITLKVLGVAYKNITDITGISARHMQNLVGIAISCGWKVNQPLLDSDVKDKPGRGRKGSSQRSKSRRLLRLSLLIDIAVRRLTGPFQSSSKPTTTLYRLFFVGTAIKRPSVLAS